VAKSEIAKKCTVTLANGKKEEGINPVKDETGVTLSIGGKSQKIAFSDMAQKDGKPAFVEASSETRGGLKLTSADVASNGDIYVVDGYGTSWIFVFDGSAFLQRAKLVGSGTIGSYVQQGKFFAVKNNSFLVQILSKIGHQTIFQARR
jgi:hypothetical protein